MADFISSYPSTAFDSKMAEIYEIKSGATKIPSFTNILKNPQFNGLTNWGTAADGFVLDTTNKFNSCNTVVCNRSGLSTATPTGFSSDNYNCAVGETYTLSAFVKLNAAKIADLRNTKLTMALWDSSAPITTVPVYLNTQNIVADVWTKVSLSTTISLVAAVKISVYIVCEGNGSMRVALPQLEVGNTYYATQATIDSMIDSGSNANGNYIKYGDGTMICRIKQIVADQAIISAYGSLFLGYRAWTFPAPFIDTVNLVVSPGEGKWGTGASWQTSAISVGTTSCQLNFLDTISRAAGTNFVYSVTAIGRWK